MNKQSQYNQDLTKLSKDAEKIRALGTAKFFSLRQQRADFYRFDAVMNRTSGQSPIEGDVIGDS